MKIKRYANTGAIIADDLSPNLDDEYSYTYTDTENTVYGNRLILGNGTSVDYNDTHDFILQTGIFSLGVKIKADYGEGVHREYIMQGVGNNDTSWVMSLYSNGVDTRINFNMYYNDSPIANVSNYPIPDFDNDRFYSIMVTGDGSNLRLYIDGILVETGYLNPEVLAVQTSNTTTYSGVVPTQPSYILSDIMLFDRTLSYSEIYDIAANTAFDHMNFPIFSEYYTNGDLVEFIDETNATNIANNRKDDSVTDLGLTFIQVTDFKHAYGPYIGVFVDTRWGWDISTLSETGTYSIEAQIPDSAGQCFMSSDGLHVYADGLGVDRLYQYNLTVPFDVTTASFYGNCSVETYNNTYPYGLYISDDGVHGYSVKGSSTNSILINQYVFATPFDILTMTRVATIDIPTPGIDFDTRSITFLSDGSRFMATSRRVTIIAQVSLSTPWDITTATLDGTITPPISLYNSPLYLTRDGTHMIGYAFNDEMKEFKLNTPNNVLDGLTLTGVKYSGIFAQKSYGFNETSGSMYTLAEISFNTNIVQYDMNRI